MPSTPRGNDQTDREIGGIPNLMGKAIIRPETGIVSGMTRRLAMTDGSFDPVEAARGTRSYGNKKNKR